MKSIRLAILILLSIGCVLPAHAQFSRITGITGTQNTGTQDFYAASPFTIKAGPNCSWSSTGTVHTFDCSGGAAASVPFSGITNGTNTTATMTCGTGCTINTSGSGTINGTAGGSTTQLQYNNAGVFGGVAGSAWDGTSLSFSHTATATGNGFIQILGDGLGSNVTLLDVVSDDFNTYTMCQGNASIPQRWCFFVNDVSVGAEAGWLVLTPLNAGGGLSVVGSAEAFHFYASTSGYSSNVADPADTGIYNLGNAEAGLCAEHNPTGTDDCITLNASNQWSLGAMTASGQISSTLATGTAPFAVASTTNVANLNASSLNGATFAAPGAIGSGTPSTGVFTTVNGMTITSSTGTYTLTNGKTFSVSNTMTLAGTDGSTYTFPAASATIPRAVFSGTKALATGAIASTACNIDTLSASGTLTTDNIIANFNANVDAVTGYVPATTGSLRITVYPEADNIKISVCNPTVSSITPGAVTLNLRVMR